MSIIIADYDPAWPQRFDRERAAILRACGDAAFVRIEHIGSTAVPGLAAKPIIDIMPGLRSLDDAPPVIPRLESIGYIDIGCIADDPCVQCERGDQGRTVSRTVH